MSGVGKELQSSKGPVEKEEGVIRRWKKAAKGKPIRWRMLRDCVACVSLGWMSTSEIQIAMRRLWALKNRTTRDILEELEQEKSIIQEQHDMTKMFKWGSTPSGVDFWIGHVSRIPARTAQVVETSRLVSVLEG